MRNHEVKYAAGEVPHLTIVGLPYKCLAMFSDWLVAT